MKLSSFAPLARMAVTIVCFALLMVFMGWLTAPDLPEQIAPPPPSDLPNAADAVHVEMDLDNPPVVWRDVDYSEGEKAKWYPKGESPLLAELVEQGKLPPVAERTGSEPVVLEGVDGIGRYGGTWHYQVSGNYDQTVIRIGLAGCTLVRFSPYGLPVVPHIAKSYEISDDNREFTFTLREGMKWSDGHPFTADDILYYWENECLDPEVLPAPPPLLLSRGVPAKIEKLGTYKFKISFEHPNGVFLTKLATAAGAAVSMLNRPAHYLSQFHPRLGDPEFLKQQMEAFNLPSATTVYRRQINQFNHPEYPRLWPWIYRTYKANPPQSYVRNPYYFAVDTEGNQLPYVDRVLFHSKDGDLVPIALQNGESTMQNSGVPYAQYTMLMDQREEGGYEIYHWFDSAGSLFVISPNLNLRVDPDKPDTKWKHQLLNDKRFRQALSLAINRKAIIFAEFNGIGEPAQSAPGKGSPFYNDKLFNAYTDYDPERANALLDELGLTKRDIEGYRCFPDGTPMTWVFTVGQYQGPDEFVVDDWAAVGVRAIMQLRQNRLYWTQLIARELEISSYGSGGEHIPILGHGLFVPGSYTPWAPGFGRWRDLGGLYGNPEVADTPGALEPPEGHPVRLAMEAYDRACEESDVNKQIEHMQSVLDIAAENLWTINICTCFPHITYVDRNLHNVPKVATHYYSFQTPSNCGSETFYFDEGEPTDTPATLKHIQNEILHPTSAKYVTVASAASADSGEQAEPVTRGGRILGRLLKYGFAGIFVMLMLMTAVRHPYIGRRLLIMIPTLAIVSVIIFVVIQLPPGDFTTSRIMELEQVGQKANMQEIEDMRKMFYLNDPMPVRYARWMGLYWFLPEKVEVEKTVDDPTAEGGKKEVTSMEWSCFQAKDKGLLQGYMGRSADTLKSVNDIVGDRILLTLMISLGTILFTWSLAIPIGIYSAVRQYSLGDYVLTLLGFFGMCVPPFLLAILLMFFSKKWFDMGVTGLFSPQYGAQDEWDWPKMLDLLKHIWLPVLIMGVGGTAGMIRIMRANLLDELKKPYVTTARAKGVRPVKLLFKYPVRLALNPFISGIGGLFPMLVSGGAIVAIVLSLPTVGPLMLESLLKEDFYPAGSLLMVLSVLGIFGTLVSDLLLLWLDPRIRFQGGSK